MEALDTLNRGYGHNTVAIASAGTNRIQGRKEWHAVLLHDKPERRARRSGALKNKPWKSV